MGSESEEVAILGCVLGAHPKLRFGNMAMICLYVVVWCCDIW